MKLHEHDRSVQITGDIQTQAYMIKATSKAFRILSSGIYSDKIGAIIREISCNAYDSHVEAGKRDIPFEVHLPNPLEPWFAVRDYGVGLSHADVITIYSTYFESTKTETNDAIGCLGLGSKSPFAYSDAFTVVSRFNGELRNYSAFMDSTQFPNICLLGDVSETNNCNGLEVRIPVKEEDVNEFCQKAQAILRFFNPLPVITGNKSFNIEPVEYIFSGDGWGIRKKEYGYSSSGGVTAIQGNVAYPISNSALYKVGFDRYSGVKIDLFFNIGELDVAADRESLGYDNQTIENIKSALGNVNNTLITIIETEINKCGTLWDACVEAKKFINDANLKSLIDRSDIKWSGTPLSETFEVLAKEIGVPLYKKFVMYKDYTKRGKSIQTSVSGNVGIVPTSRVSFYYNDIPRGAISRVLDNAPKSPCLIHFDDPNIIAKISDSLGGVEILPVSSLPKPESIRRVQYDLLETKLLQFYGSYEESNRSNWNETDHPMEAGGFYVVIDRFKVVYNGKLLTGKEFTTLISQLRGVTLINQLRGAGVLDAKKIFGIRKRDVKKKFLNDPRWVNFMDYLGQRIIPNRVQLSDNIQKIKEFDVYPDYYSSTLYDSTDEILKKTERFVDFFDKVEYYAKLSKDTSVKSFNLLLETLKYTCGFDIEIPKAATNILVERRDEILKRYPLIPLLNQHKVGYNTEDECIKEVQDYIDMVNKCKEKDDE